MLQFTQMVRTALEQEEVLALLTQSLEPAQILNPRRRNEDNSTKRFTLTQYDAAIKLQSLFRVFLKGRRKPPTPSPAMKTSKDQRTASPAAMRRHRSRSSDERTLGGRIAARTRPKTMMFAAEEHAAQLAARRQGYLDSSSFDVDEADAAAETAAAALAAAQQVPSTASASQPSANAAAPTSRLAMISEHFNAPNAEYSPKVLGGFNAIRYTYITVCEGRFAIRNHKASAGSTMAACSPVPRSPVPRPPSRGPHPGLMAAACRRGFW